MVFPPNVTNRVGIIGVVCCFTGLVAYSPPSVARSSTHVYIVNSTRDAIDVNVQDGECQTATSGECTLRAAIQQANAMAGANTIILPTGSYQLTIQGSNEDAAIQGDLDITDDLTVNGAGIMTTTLNGGGVDDRILHVLTGTVTLTHLAIQHGSSGSGGGILNVSTLTLDHCLVASNTASVGVIPPMGGGGIYNSGLLRLEATLVRDNEVRVMLSGAAIGAGGGILNSGTLLLNNSTVRNNRITGAVLPNFGGGIANSGVLSIQASTITNNHANTRSGFGGGIESAGIVTITSSMILSNTAAVGGGILNRGKSILQSTTVAGNFAGGQTQEFDPLAGGGGISNSGLLTITNSTISENTTWGDGGGISGGATLIESVTIANNSIASQQGYRGDGGGIAGQVSQIHNTIIAGNQDASLPQFAPDCSGNINSQGFNLVGDVTGCGFASLADDQVGNATNPIDARLDSLYLNGGLTFTKALLPDSPAVDQGDCGNVTTDQRGISRPQGVTCDIGSYELLMITPTETPMSTETPTIAPTIPITPTQPATPTAVATPMRLFLPAVAN